MDQSLRQRGWSIHSEDHESRQRPRADSHLTCDTEPSMSEAEKLHLLGSAFEGEDGGDLAVPPRIASVAKAPCNSPSVKGGEDYLSMVGEEESEDGEAKESSKDDSPAGKEPPKKRRKTGDEEAVAAENESGEDNSAIDLIDSSSSDDDKSVTEEKNKTNKRPHVQLTAKQQEQLDLAKNKLSKFAARLFDPNRRRGLVEAPKIIPLNDEFLTAFGKREKEYDDLSGRMVDVDKTPLDVIDVSDDEDENGEKPKSKDAKKVDFSAMSNCKVKLTNLSYATTIATIARSCGDIGPIVDVNLILDDHGRSLGRAYVVFEEHEAALLCASQMNQKSFEGRTLYVSVASASSSGRKSLDSSKPKKKQDSRYWERDISTKCNSCGQVGHIAKNCPNEEKLKPCGLCAGLGHDAWSCPQKSVCFNCGVPGHVSRECKQRRGLPERVVCTICCQSGHHRSRCRERVRDALTRDAVCIQCGEKGHTMCSDMRWFFGLKGVTCFNCGGKDHLGLDCDRPNLDVCSRNPDVALNEINRSGAMSLSDQVSNQRSNRESRSIRQNSGGDSRPMSMPPPRNRGGNDDYSRRPSNNSGRDSRRREPSRGGSHHRF